jgi:hypothetical protein
MQASQPQSIEELLEENYYLKIMVDLMAMEVAKVKANNATSKAYCIIMTQAVRIAKANLDCQKCITH